MKVWLRVAVFFAVVLLLSLRMACGSNPDIVGEEHFVRMKPLLDDIRKKAEQLPVKPGKKIDRYITKSRSILGRSRVHTRVIRDDKNRIFIIFDMGGGFLGRQGYIYSEEPNVLISSVDGMPLEESNTFYQLRNRWWSYDGDED